MRHLRSFEFVKAIAKAGSIRAAAENLAISPSALNRHIQTLEQDLGIQIFDRLVQGVRLSAEGELFFHFALHQLAGFKKLKSQIDDIKGLRTGEVRIGISPELNPSFIHNQITTYQQSHPQVSFSLRNIDHENLNQAFESNQIDFALFYQPILNRNLHVFHAVEMPIHAALPNEVKTKETAALRLHELMDYPIIMPAKDTELRRKVDSACEKHGVELQVMLECSDPISHLNDKMRSRITFCLPFAEDFENCTLRGYKLLPMSSKELLTGYISIVAPTHNRMPVAVQKFVEQLVAALEENKGEL